MKNTIKVVKKSVPIVLFGAFAALFALSFLYISPSVKDALIASRASSDGFFSAVSFGADMLGEGIAASFLCTLLAVCPLFVRNALSFILCIVTIALAASLPFTKNAGNDVQGRSRTLTALVFTAALFAVTGKEVLSETVFSISGIVHCVLPAVLILTFAVLADGDDSKRASLYAAPAVVIAIAMLSYQAAVAALVIAAFAFIRTIRDKSSSLLRICSAGASLTILTACTVMFLVSSWGFPDGISHLWVAENFFASILGPNGFFTLILIFMLFTAVGILRNDIIPAVKAGSKVTGIFVLRIALCVLSALTFAALILYSPLIRVVETPLVMIVPRFLITVAIAIAIFLIDMHSGKDRLSARFGLSAAVSLFAVFVTYTYGADSYYIPIVLILPVLARLFTLVQTNRVATVVVH